MGAVSFSSATFAVWTMGLAAGLALPRLEARPPVPEEPRG